MEDILTENTEVRFMSRKGQHDKIGILQSCHEPVCKMDSVEQTYQSVNDVMSVWVMAWIAALTSNEVHDLVLTLTGYAGVRDYDLKL